MLHMTNLIEMSTFKPIAVVWTSDFQRMASQFQCSYQMTMRHLGSLSDHMYVGISDIGSRVWPTVLENA